MFYLTDAAIILAIAVALVIWSWQTSDARRTPLENTVLGLGFSLGMLGTFPLFDRNTNAIPFGFLLLFLASTIFFFRNRQQSLFKNQFQSLRRGVLQLRGVELILSLYLSFICALTFFLTLAPPNANDYDSLVYHLSAPARYLTDGRISELAYDHHSYFPFLTEMLFALGLQWSGPVLAKLFHWLMLPLCCGTLIAIGSRHFSRRAGLLAACLFASIPVVQIEATTAYVDLSLSAFVLLAFMCFANWLRSRENIWLAGSGAMCGFALGTKYTGALFFGWLLLWAIATILLDKRRTASVSDRLSFKPIFTFALFALLLGSGWYLRNFFWVGNPVFPFAYEVFGGRGWTAQMAKDYSLSQQQYGFGRGLLDILLLPWRLAMTPLNFAQPFWPISSVQLVDPIAPGRFEVLGHVLQSLCGPALLAFGAPTIFLKNKPRVIGFLIWSCAFFWVFWMLSSQQLRYLIPTLALFSVVCGWGVLRLQQRSAILKLTIGLTLCAWLIFVPVLTAWRLRDAIPVALGQENPEIYLSRTFAGYDAMKWSSENTPVNSNFAIYGEPRDFYLKRKYFWADDPHNNLIDYAAVQTGAQLVSALKKLGATHVLWNTQPERNGGFGGPPPQMAEAVSSDAMTPIFEAKGYRILKIN